MDWRRAVALEARGAGRVARQVHRRELGDPRIRAIARAAPRGARAGRRARGEGEKARACARYMRDLNESRH